MSGSSQPNLIGILVSGGLDSCILLGNLVQQGQIVQPFYIQTGLIWENEERAGLHRFLKELAAPNLRTLVCLQMPLADLYAGHWSLTGKEVPDRKSPDEAVFLPGRNALLLIKAAIWCQTHKIPQIALAPLGTSPFEDATPEFLEQLSGALNRGSDFAIQFWLPFSGMNKRQVMQLAGDLPLHLTFSCLSPVDHLHCGQCNKCAERQAAFRDVGLIDKTAYAS